MHHRPRRRAALLGAATASLVLGLGQPASATVTSTSSPGGHVDLAGDAGGDFVVVTCAGGFLSPAATPAIACGDVTTIYADPGDGSDSLNLSAVGPPTFAKVTQVQVHLDDGDALVDTVTGSQVRDVVDAGDEDSVVGGAGDDLIKGAGNASGGEGDDVLVDAKAAQGGPGDDRIVDLPSIGPYDGGAGYDQVVVDSAANDLDNLVFYNAVYSDTTMTATVSDGVTTVSADAALTGMEQIDLELPNDTGILHYLLDGSAFSGRSVLGTGNGADTVRSGPGTDDLHSGGGNDTVDPGPGADVVRAVRGNDTVGARDGSVDLVDCGDGTDTVVADAVDVLTGCELVSVPAPETGKVSGPKKVVKGAKATFTFSSPAPGAAFECRVDKGTFKACASPFKLATRKLKTGKHTLFVRAVLPPGNADPSPAARPFKVVAKR